MKALGDRRGQVRLEVVGALWGTLEINERARIVNISGTGALIASPVPATVDSTQTVKLTLRGREIQLEARVRHANRVVTLGSDGAHYRIGLEFLGSPATLEHTLDTL